MQIRRAVVAVVSLLALHAGCAKGEAMDGGGSPGDAATDMPDAAIGVDQPDSGHLDPPDAGGGGPITLTHSNSMALVAETGVNCSNGFGHSRNNWYRVFNLPELGVNGALAVNQMTIGAQEANSGDGGGQPVTVKIHTLNGEFIVANLTELGRTKITVPDTELEMFTIPITASVPAGSVLVAEIAVPDGQSRGDYFWPGANSDGQTGPTFIRDQCGASGPTDVVDIGFPDFHLVLSVDAIEQ